MSGVARRKLDVVSVAIFDRPGPLKAVIAMNLAPGTTKKVASAI
jgi:hypothetical protein